MKIELTNFANSPTLNFLTKNKKRVIALGTTTALTFSIAVGSIITPVKIAHFQNQQTANAYSCGNSRSYGAWWGLYFWLDACSARNVASLLKSQRDFLNPLGYATGFWPSVAVPISLYAWRFEVVADTLNSCSRTAGQAYYKLVKVNYWYYPDASCY